jgi:hypothetical protein
MQWFLWTLFFERIELKEFLKLFKEFKELEIENYGRKLICSELLKSYEWITFWLTNIIIINSKNDYYIVEKEL